MIVALLNQKGGVGKTTLATHIAGELALRGQHVVLLDTDPQGPALDRTPRRNQLGLPRLFGAVGFASKPCTRKYGNWPGAAITLLSMARHASPPWCARHYCPPIAS